MLPSRTIPFVSPFALFCCLLSFHAMDHVLSLSQSFQITAILFTIYLDATLCLYINSSNCTPRNCGNGLNIGYPFWIPGRQEAYCGSPMFNITCRDKKPVLRIADDDYIIRDIFYANNSILLSQAELYDVDNRCPTPQHNFSVEGTPFSYGPETVDLFFFYNCTKPYDEEKYTVDCASDASNQAFAVFHVELLKHRNYSEQSCQPPVNAPVTTDLLKRLLEQNYTDIMKKGFVLQWDGVDCINCQKSGGHCGYYNEFFCRCDDYVHRKTCDDGKNRQLKLSSLIIGIFVSGVGVLIVCFTCYCYMKYRKERTLPSCIRKPKDCQNIEAFATQFRSLAPRRYTYKYIKKMTKSFKDKIGKGGYGDVYRGNLLDNRPVAVKILHTFKGSGEEFINEVASISRTSHVNIVTLLGFCFDGCRRALVYDFMPNGSLEKYIHGGEISNSNGRHLGRVKVYEIAIGIAQGLEYLHKGCNTRILHFDIKPHNILLDEYFRPKISDFGLARLCAREESEISMTGPRGTIGCIAPELVCRNFGAVSHKSDVYSYGMMLLEMVGRRKNVNNAVSHASEVYFPYWAYQRLVLDGDLKLQGVLTQEENEIARKMILVALWCIQAESSQRPAMSKVIEMLESDLQALEIPPKPFVGSPSRS